MRLVIFTLAALFLNACDNRHAPTSAVRAFAQAAREGSSEQVMHLIGPATRSRLEADARLAAKQGGRYEVNSRELIALGWTTPRFRIEDVYEIERRGEKSRVAVSGKNGAREEVSLVKEADGWKIELP